MKRLSHLSYLPVVLILALLAFGCGSKNATTKWEYGSLIFTSETNTWSTGTESIHENDSEKLFKRLGGKVTGNQLTHTPAFLDLLGQKGWELVDVSLHPDKPYNAYFFKRATDTDK